jgi:hypothetical protein
MAMVRKSRLAKAYCGNCAEIGAYRNPAGGHIMSKVAAVPVVDQPDKFERFQDAMFLASNAFSNIEQLFLILRGETEGHGDINKERITALIQIGIDVTRTQAALVEKEADAFHEVRHG